MDEAEKATRFAKKLLKIAREEVRSKDYNQERLPDWIHSARVAIGRRHKTTIFLFSPSTSSEDEFEYHGVTGSLFELVTNVPTEYIREVDYTPYHEPAITPSGNTGIHVTGDSGDQFKAKIIDIEDEVPQIFEVKHGHHVPFFVSNIFFRHISGEIARMAGYVPFVAMFHDYDFEVTENLLRIFRYRFSEYIDSVHGSEIGDFYEQRSSDTTTITTSKEKSVIVLGDYDGGEHEEELSDFRDELESRGYYATLIKDLPSHPSQSLPQKVKLWCLTSRFVVLIDREPSGHVREYTELSKEDIPLALLRENGTGSTYMIGHERHTNQYIELFEFSNIPNEVTTDVIEWAEQFINYMSETYDEEYPWRNQE